MAPALLFCEAEDGGSRFLAIAKGNLPRPSPAEGSDDTGFDRLLTSTVETDNLAVWSFWPFPKRIKFRECPGWAGKWTFWVRALLLVGVG